ncbi:membrane protein, exporter [Candidatus Burkholderia verschuerenii]|uniref:Membrane protein, exporter n=2 Tax=Candidatus Burkholderia verschuerenii TaxID=242163 RepID=A0A0L0MI06_9BURK|nr:membrane protein, exporter [Candidatus Burkholderia verschuerenii]
MLLAFRSAKLVALGYLSTAIGVLCALAVRLAVFGELHLLTLIFGASLIGEAVDYSIQLFVAHLAMGSKWETRRGLSRVRAGLTVALGTSLFGYAILAAMLFPALAQIAIFAIVGLGSAYASVLWLLPELLRQPARRAPKRLFESATFVLDRWRAALAGRRGAIVAATVVVVSVPGWLRLASDDDIHLLVKRDASLTAQERVIREAIGFEGGSQFFLVRGEDQETVLTRTEALVARLDKLVEQGDLRSVQALTRFVPSAQTQARDRKLLDARLFSDDKAVFNALVASHFRDDVARAYIAAHLEPHVPLRIETWLRLPMAEPYRQLWMGRLPEGGYAAIAFPIGAGERVLPALSAAVKGLPGVAFVDKAASVSSVFGKYRRSAGLWLVAALGVMLVSLAWRYGMKPACALAAPVTLSIGATLALFGYVGIPLNLFHWLALMLVLCVGSNYAVFLREGMVSDDGSRTWPGAIWAGVLLSALLSFGSLSLTSMPALQSFGMTLSVGIALSALLSPIGFETPVSGALAQEGC